MSLPCHVWQSQLRNSKANSLLTKVNSLVGEGRRQKVEEGKNTPSALYPLPFAIFLYGPS